MGLTAQDIISAYKRFKSICDAVWEYKGAEYTEFSREDVGVLKDKLGLSDVSSDIFADIFLVWLSRNETCIVIFFPHQVFV